MGSQPQSKLSEFLVGDLGPARRHLDRLHRGLIQYGPQVVIEIRRSVENCVDRIQQKVKTLEHKAELFDILDELAAATPDQYPVVRLTYDDATRNYLVIVDNRVRGAGWSLGDAIRAVREEDGEQAS